MFVMFIVCCCVYWILSSTVFNLGKKGVSCCACLCFVACVLFVMVCLISPASIEALPGVWGNRGIRPFISGNKGTKV